MLDDPLDMDPRFLSTPSARRATYGRGLEIEQAEFLSTPSARRATCGRPVPSPPR